MLRWLSKSNRSWHLLCVYLVSLVLGWASGITAIVCLEFKDMLHAKSIHAWDWADVIAGMLGCAIGGTIHWILFKHW